MPKKIVVLALAVLGLVIPGCGSSPCDQLEDRANQSVDSACDGKTCAFCECWRMGMSVNGAGECYEPEPTGTEECTDAEQDEAAACLDDPACLAQLDDSAQASVNALCP